jgi:hypothetical protein
VGVSLDEKFSPAEKLKAVQDLMEKEDERAEQIYETIGVYLGHTLALYYDMYKMEHVLLLGRVMSGTGGDIINKTAAMVLKEEYPETSNIKLHLPDEKNRRVGQAIAAACLPQIE